MASAADLLARWFRPWSDDVPMGEGDPCMALWWGKDPAVDQELHETYGALHWAAARGELDDWAQEADTAVARVLLLDQIPRNIFRGTGHMFATDGLAQLAAFALLEGPLWATLPPIHRYFALMPLMHSESVAHHDRAVEAFGVLAEAQAGCARAKVYAMALEYEHKHRDIVVRFGRYPHRNRLLGRPSTAEEEAFLTQPGSSF